MGRPLSRRDGIAALGKAHNRGCTNRGDLAKCDCPWRVRYKGKQVSLAKWPLHPVSPRDRKAATLVVNRLKPLIDRKEFDPLGELPPLGTDESLAAFIIAWKVKYQEGQLFDNSLSDCLNVISTSVLGRLSLEELASTAAVERIKGWLDAEGKKRHWRPRTWNAYRQHLNMLFEAALIWLVEGKPRMAKNPMVYIEKQPGDEPQHLFQDVRIDADIEARLLAACDKMNGVQHPPTRGILTQEKADTIRRRVAAGESQVALAKHYKVAASTVNSIVQGDIWNPAKYLISTRGTEMRRRVWAALDTGLRAGEMLQVQIKHVQWARPQEFEGASGQKVKGYLIVLPPTISKGGKTTGERETIYVGTERLARELEARRFALKNDPEAYLFGTECGRRIFSLKRAWNDLFDLAGIDRGRDKGMVWHSLRHEFISRIANITKDPVIAQHMARHKDLRTTQLYFHTARDARWKAVQGLNR